MQIYLKTDKESFEKDLVEDEKNIFLDRSKQDARSKKKIQTLS